MNFTIHQLQIFLKVIERGSITKASEELFMTQPAISIQLKNFQNQFAVPLTEIIGRKLYVTDFGKEIALVAERIVAEMENIHYKTKAYEGILNGKLTISSASTGKYVIPYFLSGFIQAHSGIDLSLDVTNKNRVVDSLKNNQTDFALVSKLPDNLAIEEEILIDNKLFLIGNEAIRNMDKPLIYREEGSATRTAMESFFSTGTTNHRKQIELTSNEAVKQAVLAGLGYSIMPIIGIHTEIESGSLFILKEKNLPIVTKWRLIWLKGKNLSPVAAAYLNFVREQKENIREKDFGWHSSY